MSWFLKPTNITSAVISGKPYGAIYVCPSDKFMLFPAFKMPISRQKH